MEIKRVSPIESISPLLNQKNPNDNKKGQEYWKQKNDDKSFSRILKKEIEKIENK